MNNHIIYFSFFSHRAPREIGPVLPSFDEVVEESDVEKAHEVERNAHRIRSGKF